jgi:rhodanese-related sulfurtransferase
MAKRVVSAVISVLLLFCLAAAATGAEGEIPHKKQTVLGKYLTAAEAYKMWQANPGAVTMVDCRTPAEYVFVGHAGMALNVPSKLVEWDPARKEMVFTDNPEFENIIKKKFGLNATILIMCRSGGRSAASVNRLAAIGFKNVYTVTDGFEGDKVKDRHSYFKGKRMKNGWKNCGAPWTYDLDPQLVYSTSE